MNNPVQTFEVIVMSIALFLCVTLSLASLVYAIIEIFF
jgi:hypothetical protein